MLRLLKAIYHHEQCSDILRTYIRLRMKQILVRKDEDLDEWLKSPE